MGPAVPSADFFCALEQQRSQALVARDLATLERLHAPEYELVTPAGRVWRRADYLGRIAEEPFYAAWTCGTMQVRASAQMALLRYEAHLAFPSGRVVRCWHTDSYERRNAGWQAVWSQATAIAPAAEPPPADSRSDAPAAASVVPR